MLLSVFFFNHRMNKICIHPAWWLFVSYKCLALLRCLSSVSLNVCVFFQVRCLHATKCLFLQPFEMLVDGASASKRKEGKKAFTEGCLSKELLYTCIRNNTNTQVIPQTGLSLCFELQRMHTQLKAREQGVQIKNWLQKNICLIILMHIACGGTVGVNYWWTLRCLNVWWSSSWMITERHESIKEI